MLMALWCLGFAVVNLVFEITGHFASGAWTAGGLIAARSFTHEGVRIVLVEVLPRRSITRQVIEDSVPDIPDGLVQLVHGVADLAARGVIAHQPQRCLEVQACGQQPADDDVVQAQGDPLVVFDQVQDGLGWAGGVAVFERLRAARRGTSGRLYPEHSRCRCCGRCGNNTWYPVHRGGSLSLQGQAGPCRQGPERRAHLHLHWPDAGRY
jgi:hypothetical protein